MSLDLLSLGYEILGYFLVVTIPSLRGIKCHSLATKTFQKHFTLRKMVFSSASMSFFSLGFKLLRFFRFGNAGVWEIKGHSLRTRPKIFFSIKVLRIFLAFVKKNFQLHQFSTTKYSDFFVLANANLERSNVKFWKQKIFQKFFLFDRCLVSVKECSVRQVCRLSLDTAWKVSIFGVCPVHIFPHSD